jgi:hypothetical protein
MIYIQGCVARRNLTEERSHFIYECYKKDYTPFVAEIAANTGRDLGTIDRALYTFGQFLKLVRPFLSKD